MLSNRKKKISKIDKVNRWNLEKIENLPFLSEDEALNFVFHRSKLDCQNKEKARKIYQLIKVNIPKRLKGIITFRYRYNISANIRNYRIFLFPSEDKDKIQLIYPKDDWSNLLHVLPEKRREKLSNSWEFKYFSRHCFTFYFDEVLSFHEMNWKSFSKACKMAKQANEARKTRSREENIKVIWSS